MLKKEIFIKKLFEITKGMKQKEIAAIMGCTEGTLSKYLNPDKKDFPPVEKLYNIAVHFGVSIDWLVGVQIQKIKNSQLSLRDICSSIVKIHDSSHFKFETISKKETCCKEIYGGYIDKYEERENKYLCIYFSNWVEIDEDIMWQIGNSDLHSITINTFLARFQKINTMLNDGALDHEMYAILLEKYLNDVPDNEYFYIQ